MRLRPSAPSRTSTTSPAALLQLCALAVLLQLLMWDTAQLAFLVPVVPVGSFWLAEAYKLLVAAVLVVPSAMLLGRIFPSLLRSPVLATHGRTWLLGLMNTANAIACAPLTPSG